MSTPSPSPDVGRSRFRKLRIAWSVLCGIACVLLIALWVRSYWRVYSLYENHYAPEQSTYVRSWVEVQKGSVVISKGRKDSPNRPGSGTFKWEFVSAGESCVRNEGIPSSFEISRDNDRTNLTIPCWFVLLLTGASIAIPWLRWRFSLRILLIITTLAAVVLGLIVAAAKS
jgi:hypothetical protein